MTSIVLVSRNSALALIQSEYVKDQLQKHNPKLVVQINGVTTQGDRNLTHDLATLGGKGVFIGELEQQLLQHEADLAIHSMKDVPTEVASGLKIRSVGSREHPADCLIGASELNDLGANARIGTSSLRRKALLNHLYKKTKIEPVRGNVQTRLRKLDDGEFDALVLAAAGVKRLKLENRVQTYFNPRQFVPAAAQGVLAAEYREGDEKIDKLVNQICDPEVEACAMIERKVVEGIGGDCSMAVGVYCAKEGAIFDLSAIVLDTFGTRSIHVRQQGNVPETLIQSVVGQLLGMGADELIHAS